MTLSDGSTIPSRCVIWGGGLKAESLAEHAGVGTGAGGRIDVGGDLSVPGHPNVFVAGDLALSGGEETITGHENVAFEFVKKHLKPR